MSETTLTTNTSFVIPSFPAPTAVVKLSGSFGRGTATISIAEGARGTALALETATSAYTQELTVGTGNVLTISLSGSTGASLLVQVIPIRT